MAQIESSTTKHNNNLKNGELCRTCLTIISDGEEFSDLNAKVTYQLDKDEMFEVDFKTIISLLTSLEINEGDSLPMKICSKCLHSLTNYFWFRFQCVKADLILNNAAIENPDLQLVNNNVEECVTLEKAHNERLPKDLNTQIQSNSLSNVNTIVSNNDSIIPSETLKIENTANVLTKLSESYEEFNVNIEEITNYSINKKVKDNTLKDKNDHISKVVNDDVDNARNNNVDTNNDADNAGNNGENKDINEKNINENKCHFVCHLCGKQLSSMKTLLAHVTRHTNHRPYKCQHCQKEFHLKDSLNRHMISHGTKPRVGCDTCAATFSRKDSLLIHKRIHQGIKPHACSQCSKRFLNKTNLLNHSRVHTKEFLYICAYCDKGFSQRTSLIQHIKTHTGERAHVCDICGRSFKQAFLLRNHCRKRCKKNTNNLNTVNFIKH